MSRFLLCLFALTFAPQLHAAERPPNVVLFVIDDLGQRDLGCYGSTVYKTPHADQLAKDGIRFTDYYAACPVCSPTRVSILTGRYPQRVNVTDWIPGRKDQPDQRLIRPEIRNELPLEEVTIAEALKARGYATALMGKWHLGGKGFEPEKQGFDVNVGGDHTGTPLSYFAPFQNKAGQKMPGLEDAKDGEYLTDRLASEAANFVAKHKDKPFFLYLPHYAVHTPLRAPQATIDKYNVKPAHGRQSNPTYAAMVEHMDSAVGRVLAALDEHKLTDDTLVIFTSDNGGLATLEGMPFAPTFNAPLREGKGYLYEGGVRVPLIVKWPGHIKPGTVTGEVANSNDLFDTILDATASKEPADAPKRDGRSLVPIFKGEKRPERAVYWHYPHYANQGSRPGGAVRKGNFKLIEFYEDGRRELFDVAKDLSESRNLAPEKPDVVAALAAELAAWRKEVGARMPKPNGDYKPNPPNKDGAIVMSAKTALVYGTQLRFEPLPHKNTLGFWTNKDDYATFDFTADAPGTYDVEVLQGCGKGSGGAKVVLSYGTPGNPPGGVAVEFTVKDTGGFQNFEARTVGQLKIEKAGRYTLYVKAETKPGVAVMDLRQITLTPTK